MSIAGDDPALMVRCLHDVIAVDGHPAPFDRIRIRVFYPALDDGSEFVRMSGEVPLAPAEKPWPVVVIVPGVNIGSEVYRWLADALVRLGHVVVTFDWVDMLFGIQRGLTPEMDLETASHDGYGSGPTATALAPILDHLASSAPIFDDRIDLSQVAVGGHSAGGAVALQSADPAWVPGLRAVFTYGAHTMTSTALGWPPGAVAPVPAGTPVLLMAGDRDGAISASRGRYGIGEGEHDPIRLTWDRAIDPSAPGSYLCFEGATHFTFTDPFDPTTGRAFLEGSQPTPEHAAELRDLMARVVGAFLDQHLTASESVGPTVAELTADHLLVIDQDHRA